MSIIEYIGARYVPKFMGTYDATQAYEALDVVDNGLGTSYISKIPTPSGTPLTDTTHWAIYGATSGAIINLQNQIDTINNNITDLSTEVPKRTLDVSERTFLFIGDSYDVIQLPNNKRWSTIAATAMKVVNYVTRATGGYGFVGNSSGNTWQNLLINNPLSADEAATITDIVIGGGANDINAVQSDVAANMWSLDTYLRNTFPNLKRVYLSFMGWTFGTAAGKRAFRRTYETYLINAHAIGWHWLNGVEYIMHDPKLIDQNQPDRMHPNPNGVDILGRGVAQAIMTGKFNYWRESYIRLTPNSNCVSATGNEILIEGVILDNLTQYYMTDIVLTATSNLSGYFVLGSSNVELNFPQDRYIIVTLSYAGDLYPVMIYSSSDTKEMNLWFRGNLSIPSGATFTLIGNSFNLATI